MHHCHTAFIPVHTAGGAPMTYRETSTQTVVARDVPLDPLGDSTQPHAHKWGSVGAIAPLCDGPDSCAKTQLNHFKLVFLSHTFAVTPTCAIAPTCAFARTFTVSVHNNFSTSDFEITTRGYRIRSRLYGVFKTALIYQ